MDSPRKVSIGVDIGGTNVRGALVEADAVITRRFRFQSNLGAGAEAFISCLVSHIGKLRQEAEIAGFQVAGVGIGIPGLIAENGLIHSSINLQSLAGLNLAEELQKKLGVPVVSANDANLIALGEFMAGAGRGMRSLLTVTIGTGLGSGLILDRKLWLGDGGFAAEFGHLTVVPEGLPCPCGNRGCLEQYVSASALSRHGGGRSPEELANLARQGDHNACAAFEQMGYWLGVALAGLVNTLNLSGIIIGGGVSAGFDFFGQAVRTVVRNRAFGAMAESVRIVQAELGDDAGIIGGAILLQESGEISGVY